MEADEVPQLGFRLFWSYLMGLSPEARWVSWVNDDKRIDRPEVPNQSSLAKSWQEFDTLIASVAEKV